MEDILRYSRDGPIMMLMKRGTKGQKSIYNVIILQYGNHTRRIVDEWSFEDI
jgi:hypothetical protein